jgi:hypothetical protein
MNDASGRTAKKTQIPPLKYDEEITYEDHEIEEAYPISQNQLDNAKLFSSRKDYAKTLNKNISYLEIGVAWGFSAKLFIDITNARSADLLDMYNNAFGILQSEAHRPYDGSMTHEEYIKNKFSYHPNVNTIVGNAREIVPTLDKEYDFIFFDMDSERLMLRKLLKHCSKLVSVGGVIGLTAYINYDSINYGKHIGTYNSVNEFLHFNDNWSVDGIVLHELGFHEVYIKKNYNK